MFVGAKAPQLGGFVRSGMGTRLAVVLAVLPMPAGHAGLWLCHVYPAGHVAQGVWHGPGNTQHSAYGVRAGRWLAVHATARGGWHPVALGPGAPAMPGEVTYALANLPRP